MLEALVALSPRTGGSMGIGESIASAFADEGAEVLVVDLVTPKDGAAVVSLLPLFLNHETLCISDTL